MVLSDLKEGQTCLIKEIKLSKNLQKRLNILGLTKGVKVRVVKLAPFFDPIEIEFRGYRLALRKETASKIAVELSD